MKTKSKRKPAQRQYIPRKEYRFWLRKDREGDNRLIEFIQYAKSTRQFAKVVRDGIRLIWSLRENNLDVLFELFPHLEARLKRSTGEGDSGELQQQISAAVAVGVQQAMLNMPSLPATMPVAAPLKPASAAPKVETKQAAVISADAIADNFLLSMG